MAGMRHEYLQKWWGNTFKVIRKAIKAISVSVLVSQMALQIKDMGLGSVTTGGHCHDKDRVSHERLVFSACGEGTEARVPGGRRAIALKSP
jgi:hypothetical protein